MKIALTYNLRPAHAVTRVPADDMYAEWDEPGTIAAIQAALATDHEVVLIEDNSTVEGCLRASAPDIVFNIAEGRAGPERERHAFQPCWNYGAYRLRARLPTRCGPV